MRGRGRGGLLLLLILGGAPARAVTEAEVEAAVQRGVTWLEARQGADGSFKGHWAEQGYKTGESALALLALLKSGVAPGDPRIEAGFDWLLAQPLQRTYEVSLSVLALEARYTPDPAASLAVDEPLSSQIRQRFKKLGQGRDLRWLTQAVEFLLRHQDTTGSWRYPFFGEADLSNAQFALLALVGAQRLGLRVAEEPFLRAADYLVTHQEGSGPAVTPFEVPAAERPLAGLLDARERQAARRRTREERREGTRERERETPTATRAPMQARGWGYRPGQGPRGSMTAAGVAMLVVIKSALEEGKAWDRLGAPVEAAMRDGAAWLAHHFRADQNPGAEPDWLFYYLYTLERAGTLLALDRFGARDWYQEGAAVILARQQADGSIKNDTTGQSDQLLAGTCLALLFLKRSTVPVLKRVITGGDAPGAAAPGGPALEPQPGGGARVTLRLASTPGRRVTVAGSWNGWSKEATPLEDGDGDGVYQVTVTLPAGRHAYKFVLDGSDWQPDAQNPASEPDGHGGSNSVLEVP